MGRGAGERSGCRGDHGASRGGGGEHSLAVAWASPPGERVSAPPAGSGVPPRALSGTSVSWGAGVPLLPALDARPVDSSFPAGSRAPPSSRPGSPFLPSAP